MFSNSMFGSTGERGLTHSIPSHCCVYQSSHLVTERIDDLHKALTDVECSHYMSQPIVADLVKGRCSCTRDPTGVVDGLHQPVLYSAPGPEAILNYLQHCCLGDR